MQAVNYRQVIIGQESAPGNLYPFDNYAETPRSDTNKVLLKDSDMVAFNIFFKKEKVERRKEAGRQAGKQAIRALIASRVTRLCI